MMLRGRPPKIMRIYCYMKIVEIQPTRKTLYRFTNDIIREKTVLELHGCMNDRGNYDTEKLVETQHLDREIWEKAQ